jgi:hypothetical protein
MFDLKMIGIISIVIILIGGLIYYFYSKNNKNNEKMDSDMEPNIDRNIDIDMEEFTEGKVINYYGGHYCPHSNKDSPMYNLMTKKLMEKYPDVNINIYWSDKNIDKFKNNNIEYVPTILNNNKEKIVVRLPEGINTEEYTDEQLENILMENIYNQL